MGKFQSFFTDNDPSLIRTTGFICIQNKKLQSRSLQESLEF